MRSAKYFLCSQHIIYFSCLLLLPFVGFCALTQGLPFCRNKNYMSKQIYSLFFQYLHKVIRSFFSFVLFTSQRLCAASRVSSLIWWVRKCVCACVGILATCENFCIKCDNFKFCSNLFVLTRYEIVTIKRYMPIQVSTVALETLFTNGAQ